MKKSPPAPKPIELFAFGVIGLSMILVAACVIRVNAKVNDLKDQNLANRVRSLEECEKGQVWARVTADFGLEGGWETWKCMNPRGPITDFP